ncbi:hypothetical protein BC833DRAFT_585225 [Globomyces pollinis-pini]|nr:hypothetical protein BC833DRAFT_585225 [Globomyces pollinis-pini]
MDKIQINEVQANITMIWLVISISLVLDGSLVRFTVLKDDLVHSYIMIAFNLWWIMMDDWIILLIPSQRFVIW